MKPDKERQLSLFPEPGSIKEIVDRIVAQLPISSENRMRILLKEHETAIRKDVLRQRGMYE